MVQIINGTIFACAYWGRGGGGGGHFCMSRYKTKIYDRVCQDQCVLILCIEQKKIIL